MERLFSKQLAFFFLLYILICVISCRKKNNYENIEINSRKLNSKELILISHEIDGELAEPFVYVTSAFINDSMLVILDGGTNKLYIYKHDTLVNVVGNEGQAPSEFNLQLCNGVVKISNNKIYILDFGNNRIQIFSLNGEYMDCINGIIIASDFDLISENILSTFIFGNIDLCVINEESKEVLEEIESSRNLDISSEKFPFPFRKIELFDENSIFVLITDEYSLTKYSLNDTFKESFIIETDLIKINNELKEQYQRQVPFFADRIRDYQLPCFDMFADLKSLLLWVYLSDDIDTLVVFDVFDKEGNYLQRVGLKLNDEYIPLCIYNNKFVFFDNNDSLSTRIVKFDLSGLDFLVNEH